MNFERIFFQLLIVKTLYQCGLSELVHVAPISEITVSYLDKDVKYSTPTQCGQYEREDRFCILNEDPTLYLDYFKGDFTSRMIEFSDMHGVEIDFFLRRSDEQILWIKCVFSERKFMQAFFRKIYSYQEKGESVVIFRMARYFNDTKQMERLVKHGNLLEKDTASFSFGIVEKIFYITHILDSDGTTEVDLIFRAKNFAISKIYQTNKIALCNANTPNERFLIRFTSNKDAMAGELMLKKMQHDNPYCPFPRDLTPDQLLHYLDAR